MINEIDIEVSEYLKTIGLKYNVLHVANKGHDKNWPCDEWLVTFNGESFTYKTGLGHRLTLGKNSRRLVGKDVQKVIQLKSCINVDNAIIPININNGHSSGIYAVKPTQASVLHCLLLDSEANNDSFNNWCDNFGYDNDSMKAFKIYQACCDNAEKLNKVFTREQLIKLNELLEEY